MDPAAENSDNNSQPKEGSSSDTCPPQPWLTATCHCGSILITLPHKPERINECRCSLCYRYGALWGYYIRGDVEVKGVGGVVIEGTEAKHIIATNGIDSYIRREDSYPNRDEGAKGDISFNRCGVCGVLTHWWREKGERVGPEHKMGVNLRLVGEGGIEKIERRVTWK
ncbi:hypothetical protein B0T17DRAFT_531531 [Bombardia bombarda]|uniref:CENP-V/GFA domain-containing protein n=1 Tax=Bombardia bombarda TaxID=252184 RepID=A0AA39X0C5_9PEZI|nr:hypothetical protein B0T17DRAFT_531531 [Bombardia bombarda]